MALSPYQMEGVSDDPWQTDVPKHVVISNLKLRAKTAADDAVNQFSNRYDTGAIIKSIADTQEASRQREQIFNDALKTLGEPPPQEDTQVNTTLGEGLANLAGSVLGDRNSSNSTVAIAARRQGKEFDNRMRLFSGRQKLGQLTLDKALHDIDYYRSLGSQREQTLANAKGAIADFEGRAKMHGADLENSLDLKHLEEIYAQAAEQRQQAHRLQLATYQGDIDQKLQELRSRDSLKAMGVEAAIKGLMENIEDPNAIDDAGNPLASSVDDVFKTIADSGLELPPGMKAVYKSIAHGNFQDKQFKQMVTQSELRSREAQTALGNRREALDEQLSGVVPGSLGKGLNGGFQPMFVNPNQVPDLWSSRMPDAGNAQKAATELAGLQSEKDQLDKDLAAASEKTAPDERGNSYQVHPELKLADIRKQKADVDRKLNLARGVIKSGATPEYKQRIADLYRQMKREIGASKGDPAADAVSSALPGGSVPGASAMAGSTKEAQNAIRLKFRNLTGFYEDDPWLDELAKQFPEGHIVLPAMSGPIKAKHHK